MFANMDYFGVPERMLKPSQMICCHTPFKKLVPELADEFVLVTGIKDVMRVSKAYGLKKAIHVEELYALMPQLFPLGQYDYPEERKV